MILTGGRSKSKPTPIKSGKVREIYHGADDKTLEIFTTDRVSAFDHILNQTIPGKGEILNEMSCEWFDMTCDIVENHVIEKYKSLVTVKNAKPLPVECIVRGTFLVLVG